VQHDNSGVDDDEMDCIGGDQGGSVQTVFATRAGPENTMKLFIITANQSLSVHDYCNLVC